MSIQPGGSVLDPLNLFGPGGAQEKAAAKQKTSNDTQGMINQQRGSNVADWQMQTGANRADVSTPFGSQQWSQDPDTGEWKLTTGLSGQLAGASNNLQREYADMLRTAMADGSAARDQAIDAAYKQSTSRLDPQWDKRQEALRTQLLNQGLNPETEAGKNAMSDFGLQRNDAYSSAMNSAIAQGREAGNDVFRNNLAARNAPLMQMGLLQQLLQTPDYKSAGGVQGTDVIGATQGDDRFNLAAKRYNRESQQWMADKAFDVMKFGTDTFMNGVGGGLGGK